MRLERARRLLLESDMSIPKVAAAAGFNTASYFVQVFREKIGTTPARYRANIRMGCSGPGIL
jgi:LacI family transcriptional regulator